MTATQFSSFDCFKCPNCSGTIIEMVMVDAIVFTDLRAIDQDGYVDYDTRNQTIGDGVVDRYQCENCGSYITTQGVVHSDQIEDESTIITDSTHLAQWLRTGCFS